MNEFKVHLLNEKGLDKARNVQMLFELLLSGLDSLVPKGRPYSLVVTNLQQACMWAKNGIAELPENQIPEPKPELQEDL